MSSLIPSSPFLLPAYQELWWQHLGHGEKHELELEKNGQVIGKAALFLSEIENKKVLRLIGARDLSDYLDVVVKPGSETDAYQSLIEQLANSSFAWDELWLESIPDASLTLSTMATLAEQQAWQVIKIQQDICPVITLPQSWEEYLSSLESSTQRSFTKLLRSIREEDEIEYELVDLSENIDEAMTDFIRLHKLSGENKQQFWTAEIEAFFHDLGRAFSQEQILKLYFLKVNGERAAALMIFEWQNQFLLYNSGFDAYRYGHMGVGNALILHTIKEALQLGKVRYDFMRGDEKYKFQFGAVAEPVWDLKIKKSA